MRCELVRKSGMDHFKGHVHVGDVYGIKREIALHSVSPILR